MIDDVINCLKVLNIHFNGLDPKHPIRPLHQPIPDEFFLRSS